jgi:hypothetical protein
MCLDFYELSVNKTMFYKDYHLKSLPNIVCSITQWGGVPHKDTTLNFSRLSEILNSNGKLHYAEFKNIYKGFRT